jgi:hypothetical protein
MLLNLGKGFWVDSSICYKQEMEHLLKQLTSKGEQKIAIEQIDIVGTMRYKTCFFYETLLYAKKR